MPKVEGEMISLSRSLAHERGYERKVLVALQTLNSFKWHENSRYIYRNAFVDNKLQSAFLNNRAIKPFS